MRAGLEPRGRALGGEHAGLDGHTDRPEFLIFGMFLSPHGGDFDLQQFGGTPLHREVRAGGQHGLGRRREEHPRPRGEQQDQDTLAAWDWQGGKLHEARASERRFLCQASLRVLPATDQPWLFDPASG